MVVASDAPVVVHEAAGARATMHDNEVWATSLARARLHVIVYTGDDDLVSEGLKTVGPLLYIRYICTCIPCNPR